MASMLRSGKFLRYFAGFTRNVVVNSIRETEGNFLQNSPCLCSSYTKGFASVAVPKNDINLEKQLKRLDQDVRRTGRISRRDIEEVLEEIRHQQSATSSQSLLVIRCCGNLVPEEMPEVRTALVQEIWKTLNALNVPMDISHYNALLRVYVENEHPFSPTDFLAEIESKAIEPNRVTYQRLITRYCQDGDIEGATRILEYMREKSLPVNENVFNSLILGHSQANDLESAQGILTVMKQAGLEPSGDTYTTLLCSYARHGDINEVLRIIDECEKTEIYLLDKDLLDGVYAMTVNGHGDKIDAILSKLRLSTGFNQDAVNVVLRLTNKGYEDVALKILRLMPRSVRDDGQLVDTGNFFIRQLVKANRPVEKIMKICKQLQDEGLNPKAFLIATEAGLTNGIVNNALPLLQELKNAGQPIRQHYFWPLICSVEPNQIMEIVQRMQEDFNINPNAETIRDYIIPNLKEKNWDKIVTILRNAGISNATATACATYCALNDLKIDEAAAIAESYKAFYAPPVFRQPLIIALSKTDDYQSFIRIVRQIHDNNNRYTFSNANGNQVVEQQSDDLASAEDLASEASPAESSSSEQNDFVGQIVNDAISFFRRDRVAVIEKILTGLVDQGLSISSANATRIQDRLASEMNPTISQLLGKLSSGELEPIQVNSEKRKRGIETLTIEELERFIVNVEAKNDNANNIKRHLLAACFRSKNLEKTLQVIDKIEKENFVISSGVIAQLIDLYCHHEKPTEALELYEKIKAKEPDFILDNLKTIHVADLLIKEERFDEALKFIVRNKKEEPFGDSEGSFNYITTCWRTLNQLAETGNAERVEQMFNALVENNYVQPTNVILGPLIKVHLVKDNIQKAFETFERICEKYQSTPWKNELACRLIQKEDAANLQKLTDLSTNIHGEVNSLYDLVFSFVECGRIRQARKILETPGLRTRHHRIDSACERYKNEGMVQPLEGLMEATKDLNHIDRNGIYYNLLLSYCKTEDAEKALGLWTRMQEDSVAPTDAFLIKLANLLKQKNIDVPFVVPAEIEREISKTAAKRTAVSKKPTSTLVHSQKSDSSLLSKFHNAIRTGSTDSAIDFKNQMSSAERPIVPDLSRLIELLVREERITEATKFVDEMLAMKLNPIPNVFKYYLNKLATRGDIETIERIGNQITDDTKKQISYDNRFCHANIVAGKTDEFLKKLNDDIDNAKTDEESKKIADKFPRGGALGILDTHPELLPQFRQLADKFAAKKHFGPMNILWIYLSINGNEVAAKEVFDKYLADSPRLMFQRILQTARDQKNPNLITVLVNQLRESKISEGAIGNAYSCLLDIQISDEKYDEALQSLNAAVKDVCLENINRTALSRLKSGLETQGKTFPYSLPKHKSKNDNTSSSSSSSSDSSSSDDDVSPKRPEERPKKLE